MHFDNLFSTCLQRYEMQKEFEKQQVLHELSEEDKKRYEHELKEQKEKHNKHEPIHAPGHKAQLEEVWEKEDHMDQEFDPKAFFMLHGECFLFTFIYFYLTFSLFLCSFCFVRSRCKRFLGCG